jgi:hypothetical protein
VLPRSHEDHEDHEKKPTRRFYVRIVSFVVVVAFASLPGPNYAARTTVNVPAKQVSAMIENFNYTQQ